MMIANVHERLKETRRLLESVVPDSMTAEFEARQLLAFALDTDKLSPAVYDTCLTDEQQKILSCAVSRRLNREPLQYIIGEWEFMGLPFYVNGCVLIPRPDTETLCEAVEAFIKGRPKQKFSLIDVCTGTGCVGISLSVRNGIETVLSDISEACLEIAGKNCVRNGVRCELIRSDLFENVEGSYDIITVNPPYIRTKEIDSLEPEVKREPTLALDGGEDGLDFYRRIREEFKKHINAGGLLAMEIGFDQGESVRNLFLYCGKVSVIKDMCGCDRVVTVEI